MTNEQPGLPPRPRQHPSFNEMQLWQKHLMYKQLQELQRQQQLHQLDNARRQNSLGQLSIGANETVSNQLPAHLNGVPIGEVPNYMWANGNVGGESKTPSNSQMFISGYGNRGTPVMHGSNRFMLTNDQGQTMQSVGFMPQQPDQSFYGTPVSSNRGLWDRYTKFQGMSPDCTVVMATASENQAEKPLVQESSINSFQNDQRVPDQGYLQDAPQGFQEKRVFLNAPIQSLASRGMPGNFQEVNHLQQNVEVQELQGRQEQVIWEGNLQDKMVTGVGPSHGVTSLDPTEEKILFGTDDDDNWRALFASSNAITEGYLHGNSFGSNDLSCAFPSVQSGSWSALMQEAVQASSSDNGVQEEWSGLSFQKTEPPFSSHSAVSNIINNHQAPWNDSNLQRTSSLTSRSSPLSDHADPGSSCQTDPSFQQSSKGAQNMHFDHISEQKQFLQGGPQSQMGIPNGVYMHDQSGEHPRSADEQFSLQNNHSVWIHQQNVHPSNTNGQPDTSTTGWNRSLPPDRDSEVHNNDDTKWYAQGNDMKRAIPMERNLDGSMWKAGGNYVNSTGEMDSAKCDIGNSEMPTEDSSIVKFPATISSNSLSANQDINQPILNNHQVGFGMRTGFDSLMKSRGGENMGKYQHHRSQMPQTWEAPMDISDNKLGGAYNTEQEFPDSVSNEGNISRNSHTGQYIDGRHSVKENPLTGNEPCSLTSSSRKVSAPSLSKGVEMHGFQFQPTGNLTTNMEPTDSMAYCQGPPQSLVRGYVSPDQGNNDSLQFADHIAANMGKGYSNDFRGNIKGAEEIQSKGTTPSHGSPVSASFVGSTVEFSHNKKVGQTSQNMLELLHKVDQSRDNNSVIVGNPDQHTTNETSETTSSDGCASHPQHFQSSTMQGFGLRLAPPSQRQPVPNQALPSAVPALDGSARLPDPDKGHKDQTRLIPAASLNSAHEVFQRQSQDKKYSLPGQTTSDLSYMGNQLQLQQLQQQWQMLQHQKISSITGHKVMDPSVNLSGNQADVEEYAKHVSLLRQAEDFHGRDIAAKSSLSSNIGRTPPFRLASSPDTHAPASQFYSPNSSHSQPMNAGFYHVKTSGQHLPVVETGSALQPSSISGMSKQAGFSNMVHNIWSNVSAQQNLSGVQPQKVIPRIPHSMIVSANSRDANSRTLQKAYDQGNEAGSAPSEFGISSVIAQQNIPGEVHSAKEGSSQQLPSNEADVTPTIGSDLPGQKQVPKQNSDGNSSVSLSSLEHSHQHDASKGKHDHDSLLKHHMERFSLSKFATPNSNGVLYGNSMKPSGIQQPNYSLLQQLQAMKGADSDMTKQAGKRLKGTDFENSVHKEWKESQRYIYGQNTGPNNRELVPSDVKMLSFSLGENEEKIAGVLSSRVVREVLPKETYASGQHDLQNQTQLPSASSTFMRGGDHPQTTPQVAPSWFEQYRKYKNGQILAMYDVQRSVKEQQYYLGKGLEGFDNNTLVEQKVETSQFGTLSQSTSPNTTAINGLCSLQLPMDVTDHDIVLRSKKRKSATVELLPWHKEVMQGSRRLQSISMAELDWAQSSNRLIEKKEDETDMIDDGASGAQPRRRLIVTTQLMQQLLPSVPAAILAAEARSGYESVTYFLAKSALGDACSQLSCSGNDTCSHLGSEISFPRIPEKRTYGEAGKVILSKVLEDFIGKSMKLESDLTRLDKRTSILDVRLECQELERFSLVNRLGKFHGRGHTDGVESTSFSEASSHRMHLQRYVTAHSVPGNLPAGVPCLSL